ncbi:hypothetical protein BCR39DRAFT_561881 [Naematelia encephala]|uniref:Myb-like domain-containing protein n=1 Tax=Naematelia encephala TaxID=71784 RepID=A0A1Y2AM19_9TREE|nr:hypothetical protein BCR39DRAFT_561881 [Naematelia encephala]
MPPTSTNKQIKPSPRKSPYNHNQKHDNDNDDENDDVKPSSSPDSTTSPSKKPKSKVSRPWTAGDLLIIFDVVTKRGASIPNFEGMIEGRTGTQCYSNWKNTIAPSIQKMLVERGNKAK